MTGRKPRIRKMPRDLVRQYIHLELAREACHDAQKRLEQAQHEYDMALIHKRRVKAQFIGTESLRYLV